MLQTRRSLGFGRLLLTCGNILSRRLATLGGHSALSRLLSRIVAGRLFVTREPEALGRGSLSLGALAIRRLGLGLGSLSLGGLISLRTGVLAASHLALAGSLTDSWLTLGGLRCSGSLDLHAGILNLLGQACGGRRLDAHHVGRQNALGKQLAHATGNGHHVGQLVALRAGNAEGVRLHVELDAVIGNRLMARLAARLVEVGDGGGDLVRLGLKPSAHGIPHLVALAFARPIRPAHAANETHLVVHGNLRRARFVRDHGDGAHVGKGALDVGRNVGVVLAEVKADLLDEGGMDEHGSLQSLFSRR